MTNYTAWFWSLGIGIPLLAIGIALLWRRARTSIVWRLIFCFCVAVMVIPIGFNNGHSQGWAFPTILFFVEALVDMQRNEFLFLLKIIGELILPITLGLFCVWSIILMIKNKKSSQEEHRDNKKTNL